MDAPEKLFTLYADFFNIHKGALLILDREDNQLVCWASKGLDPTTRHHLIVPPEIVLLNDDPLPRSCVKDELEPFKSFFSIREFSMLEHLHLLPLALDGKIFACFFIIDASPFPESLDTRFSEISSLLHTTGVILSESQLFSILHIEGTEISALTDLFTAMDFHIDQAREKDDCLHFLILPLKITKEEGDVEYYRIKQDILKILSSLVSGVGEVYIYKKNFVLLLVSGHLMNDMDLLTHQIFQTMQGYFNEQMPLLDAIIRSFPVDGDTAESLLKQALPIEND
ncbi:MAG: hypothetical protein KAU17_02300 [Spirochaetales bacterium]|nr:hypothetical protein [Spirochaetales bacterium]